MKGPILVPWSNSIEFLRVYDLLFSDTCTIPADFILAAQTMLAWSLRSDFPIAIESTLNFVNSTVLDYQLLDSGNASNTESPSSAVIRLSYAEAIIRFVNGVVDSQQQRMYAQPITKLAMQQDLPRIFVDARHEATHDRLPPLSYLRYLSSAAIIWLRKSYWDGMRSLILLVSPSSSPATNSLYRSIMTYKELFCSTLPFTNPIKSWLNLDALPRPVTKAISEFYSEYESAGFSYPVQSQILAFVIPEFTDPSLYKYESALWTPFLAPMISTAPLSIQLFLSSLISVEPTHTLLQSLFSLWINSKIPPLAEIITGVSEILLLHYPTTDSLSRMFLAQFLDKFTALLHPLLCSYITLLLDSSVTKMIPEPISQTTTDSTTMGEIHLVENWRVAPLGSIDPIYRLN